MLNRFFTWLEGSVPSFPQDIPSKPQATTWGFIRFYSRPFLPLIIAGLTLSVLIAVIEVRVYAFVAQYVGRWTAISGQSPPATARPAGAMARCGPMTI